MGPYSFYSDPEYRKKQAEITKKHWQLGTFNFKLKSEIELVCQNPKCGKHFYVKPHDCGIRKFCSRSCSALVNNPNRIMPEYVKLKISRALKGTHPKLSPNRFAPRSRIVCRNKGCKKLMYFPPWLAKRRKYCSNTCAMKVIGRKTTSPKASKGKSGIRTDINPNINFYSTWEANVARVFNLIGLRWQYAPRIFDLGEHTYRPDFYLPDFNSYVEIKNFLGPYSLERDKLFRKRYSKIKLDLLLKDDYLQIKSSYQDLVDNWES